MLSMLGRILLVGFLGVVIAGGTMWITGLMPVIAQGGASDNVDIQAKAPAKTPDVAPLKPRQTIAKVSAKIDAKRSIGADLYTMAAPVVVNQAAAPAPKKNLTTDPIVIPNARLALIRKQEVPAQREGVLVFIGIEIRPGENPPEE